MWIRILLWLAQIIGGIALKRWLGEKSDPIQKVMENDLAAKKREADAFEAGPRLESDVDADFLRHADKLPPTK